MEGMMCFVADSVCVCRVQSHQDEDAATEGRWGGGGKDVLLYSVYYICEIYTSGECVQKQTYVKNVYIRAVHLRLRVENLELQTALKRLVCDASRQTGL